MNHACIEYIKGNMTNSKLTVVAVSDITAHTKAYGSYYTAHVMRNLYQTATLTRIVLHWEVTAHSHL